MTALKQAPTTQYSRILGIGGVRGGNVVPNADIIGPIDSSDEWIRQRTGIISRVRAGSDEDVLDLSEGAARAALEHAGVQADELDTVIVSTVTYFRQTPAAATQIADRIGATPAAAYDISAACAGYTYGIAQADALVRSGVAHKVLVIGAEKMSDFIDPTDRSISFLLGDGAGAAVIGASDFPGIGPTVWGADGGRADLIYQTQGWRDAVADGQWPTLRQEGPAVFKWASFQMAKVAQRAIEAAGLTPNDIKAFIPHQANMRIIDQMAKQLKLPDGIAIGRDIAETGNTSAASIPLATERLYREGLVASGDLALQIGFGAGLAYGAQVVVLP
ncbi:beta-ketoacyl-ACP synthase III [Rarobacter incanus]|uniref:Beta-ketoacyl-[acyl-carrier-protein] synthase III n=1 Tax=Rarobacter incanus TaxID=153494 RepID=A0A542SMQ8_9MICO|nr:beta-ketoacyl-ACP synthase III [Rarobacter incanus]TQK75914.1 3-oxoacyl-[acyl-carrier-protein] synthase-3 [Rarobacter incanus]